MSKKQEALTKSREEKWKAAGYCSLAVELREPEVIDLDEERKRTGEGESVEYKFGDASQPKVNEPHIIATYGFKRRFILD